MYDDETCSGCGHPAREHVMGIGCSHGWVYDDQGLAVTDGCDCQWAHVSESMTEAEWRRS